MKPKTLNKNYGRPRKPIPVEEGIVVQQIQKKIGRNLTINQRLWLAEYIKNGGNATKAAAQAYNYDITNPTQYATAQTMGWENVKKLDVKEVMEIMGLGIVPLLQKAREGLSATKIYTTKDEAIEHPDYIAQHKFLETSLKLQKHLGEGISITNNQFSWQPNDEND